MWKKLRINKQNVGKVFDNFITINCPHNSKYNNYYFWFNKKLVDFKNTCIEIVYKDTFVFKLKKVGKAKYNKYKLIDELEVDADVIEDMFECMQIDNESYLIVKEPPKIELDVKVLEELKNDK